MGKDKGKPMNQRPSRPLVAVCPDCDGEGFYLTPSASKLPRTEWQPTTCKTCKGTGRIGQ